VDRHQRHERLLAALRVLVGDTCLLGTPDLGLPDHERATLALSAL
jgi:hypothetical protein